MGIISGCILTITCENASNDTIVWMVIAERKDSFITPLDIYTFGHLKCPKAERIASLGKRCKNGIVLIIMDS